jgi:hypothetical protein
MATCGGCGAETRRVRTTFHEDSSHRVIGTTDECDKCHPAMFEPRWKTERGAAAFEAYPPSTRSSPCRTVALATGLRKSGRQTQ